eukprot:g2341.t1
MSDRLYLEEACPALQQLLQRVVDEPNAQLEEMDFQDFEVEYATSHEEGVLVLKAIYPFLQALWKEGSQERPCHAMSDRLYLEEACPALQQLLQRVVDEPNAQLEEMDFQDFEVEYATSHEEGVLVLKAIYPFLQALWKEGSQERPCHGAVPPAARCVQCLACTRIWLLIGPLVQRLAWLQDAVARGDEAAKKAPMNAQEARTQAIGQPPRPLTLQLQSQEWCGIVPKLDRIVVILSIHLEDEKDVALGRAFCRSEQSAGAMRSGISGMTATRMKTTTLQTTLPLRKSTLAGMSIDPLSPCPLVLWWCPCCRAVEMKNAMKYLWAFLLPLLRAEDDPKQYPVTKVVNLLKDMQKKLEVEAEEDEEVDEKMKCWCKDGRSVHQDTEQSKAESIAGTESQLTSLGALIETSAAEAVRLSSEIGGHEGDLASSQNSLSAAEAQRKKQQESRIASRPAE